MTVVPYKGVDIFNEDGTYRKEDDVVQGRSFSSNSDGDGPQYGGSASSTD